MSILVALLFYAAAALFAYGLYTKIRQYARTPAPLKIPTTPAPTTRRGVVARLGREVVFFESLFRATKWTWLFGWLFHVSLLLVFFRHLRFVFESVPQVIVWIQFFGLYAAFVMCFGLLGLLIRRIAVPRVRYISAPSDYLMLLLLLALALTGLAMKYVAPTDVVAVKAFMIGLLTFSWQPLPNDGVLLLHLSLVLVLMVVFPISKLLHAPGLFFSPTRNQVDNPREQRHVAEWARKLER